MTTQIKKLIALAAFSCISVFGYAMASSEYTDKTAQESFTLFAAASMTDVAEEISEQFRLVSGIDIFVNPASSGTLARQIEQGASCDIFISASKKWVDYLEERGLAKETGVFARNRLVLISPPSEESNMLTRAVENSASPEFIQGVLSGDFRMLAMGDPGHVPAGAYGKKALETLGLYSAVSEKIMPTQDVRAALSLVELGEADYGIVYLTDAIASGNVRIEAVFPERSHSPIEYYCVLVEGSSEGADKLFAYMTGSGVHGLLSDKGFETVSR